MMKLTSMGLLMNEEMYNQLKDVQRTKETMGLECS